MVIARGPKPLATPASAAGGAGNTPGAGTTPGAGLALPSNSSAASTTSSSQQKIGAKGRSAEPGAKSRAAEVTPAQVKVKVGSGDTPKASPTPKKPEIKKTNSLTGSRRSSTDGKSPTQQSPVVAQFCGQLRIEPGMITTLAYGHSGKAKLLKYELKNLIQFGGLLTLFTKGTVLTMDSGCAKVITFTVLVAAVSAVAVTFVSPDPQELDAGGLEELSTYLNGFVPFVLGLYISLTLSRWWSLRVDALGKVFDALPNVLMLMSCFLRGDEYKPVQEQILRYGMLSIMLTIKAAREYYSIEDLEAKGLMTANERLSLEPIAPFQRAMVTWSWIMAVADDAFTKAGAQPAKMTAVLKKCTTARDGIQTIHTYFHTQLPFAYVHLITLLVNLNNLVVAVKCGFVMARAVATENYQEMFNQALMLVIVPLLYHGLLAISYVIQDPFGEDMLDFPIAAYQEYVAQCCEAMMIGAAKFPGMQKSDGSFEPVSPGLKPSPHKNSASPEKEGSPEHKETYIDKQNREVLNVLTTLSSQIHALHSGLIDIDEARSAATASTAVPSASGSENDTYFCGAPVNRGTRATPRGQFLMPRPPSTSMKTKPPDPFKYDT
jgi:hypothetical protein